jgi:hypothetical protein
LQYGWGIVKFNFDQNQVTYPLIVIFDLYKSIERTYHQDGRLVISDVNPSLFWDEIKFEIPKRKIKEVLKLYLNVYKERGKYYFSEPFFNKKDAVYVADISSGLVKAGVEFTSEVLEIEED